MKMRVYFDVENMEQVGACITFSRSMGLVMGMDPLAEPKRHRTNMKLGIGDGAQPAHEKYKAVYRAALIALKDGPVLWPELVSIVAEKTKVPSRIVGSKVKALVKQEVLKVVPGGP